VVVVGVVAVACPVFEEGADEAFGFAVGLWSADAGVAGCDRVVVAAGVPAVLEAFSVVGEDFLDFDAVLAVEALAVVEEGERGVCCLVGVDGGVGEA
jgi:hypothetical protein